MQETKLDSLDHCNTPDASPSSWIYLAILILCITPSAISAVPLTLSVLCHPTKWPVWEVIYAFTFDIMAILGILTFISQWFIKGVHYITGIAFFFLLTSQTLYNGISALLYPRNSFRDAKLLFVGIYFLVAVFGLVYHCKYRRKEREEPAPNKSAHGSADADHGK